VLGVLKQSMGSYTVGFLLLALFALVALAVNYAVFLQRPAKQTPLRSASSLAS
jgi:hypothetical protein